VFDDMLGITNNGRVEEIYIRSSVALYQFVDAFLVQSSLGVILEIICGDILNVETHFICFQELTKIIFDDSSLGLKITDIM
jgi:hypothetical protein